MKKRETNFHPKKFISYSQRTLKTKAKSNKSRVPGCATRNFAKLQFIAVRQETSCTQLFSWKLICVNYARRKGCCVEVSTQLRISLTALPIVHEDIRLPQPVRRYSQVSHSSVIRNVPFHIDVNPWLKSDKNEWDIGGAEIKHTALSFFSRKLLRRYWNDKDPAKLLDIQIKIGSKAMQRMH